MKDWKTTVCGILTIVAAFANAGAELAQNKPVSFPVLIAAVTTGIGLIKASDSKPAAQ